MAVDQALPPMISILLSDSVRRAPTMTLDLAIMVLMLQFPPAASASYAAAALHADIAEVHATTTAVHATAAAVHATAAVAHAAAAAVYATAAAVHANAAVVHAAAAGLHVTADEPTWMDPRWRSCCRSSQYWTLLWHVLLLFWRLKSR